MGVETGDHAAHLGDVSSAGEYEGGVGIPECGAGFFGGGSGDLKRTSSQGPAWPSPYISHAPHEGGAVGEGADVFLDDGGPDVVFV